MRISLNPDGSVVRVEVGQMRPHYQSRNSCLVTSKNGFVTLATLENAANLYAQALLIGDYMVGLVDRAGFVSRLKELEALRGLSTLRQLAEGR